MANELELAFTAYAIVVRCLFVCFNTLFLEDFCTKLLTTLLVLRRIEIEIEIGNLSGEI